MAFLCAVNKFIIHLSLTFAYTVRTIEMKQFQKSFETVCLMTTTLVER